MSSGEPLLAALTLPRHVAAQVANGGSGSGAALATLINQIAFAAKVVARETRRAALIGRLGAAGGVNPTGDRQTRLDLFANRVFLDAFAEAGLVAAVVSEELEELRLQHCEAPAQYLLAVDPLDGSKNIEVGACVGSVFAIYGRTRPGRCRDVEAELLEGATPAVGGYIFYGPATMLDYARGRRVNGFTLDHSVGEFVLTHPDMRCPLRGATYAVNTGRSHLWEPRVRSLMRHLDEPDEDDGRPYTLRSSGAMDMDLHRIMLEGGLYCYPADSEHPEGKIRLLYEATPMALVLEAAGGRASTGRTRILEIPRRSIHQTVPVVLGSEADVETYEHFLAEAS